MCSSPLAHDAWRPRGLGNTGWYVHMLLRNRAPLPANATGALDALEAAGLLGLDDDGAILERLDLYALHRPTFNTGYREGMVFLAERAKRAAIITCVQETA